MRTSASLVGSMLGTFLFESIMEEIASGSLSRSILGESVSSTARRQIFVIRRTIVSWMASSSASVATPPRMSFVLYALIGSAFFHASISSCVLYVEESEGE